MPPRVRLFVKPYCGWCRGAQEWLDRQDVQYEALDVTANAKAAKEMLRLSGQTLAPVIEADGRVLADFDAEELAAFWQRSQRGR